MARRILAKSSPGDDTKFGADDINYINQLLTGADQTGADPVDINTNTKLRHGKLRVANSGNTFVHIFNGSATASDKTLTLPDITDTVVTLTATQTLSNKTLTLPSISSISNSGTLTLPTGTTTIVSTDTTQTLTNKTISAASNTLTGVATLTGAETLTNKTIAATSNTIEGLMATPDVKKIGGWFGASNVTTLFGVAQGLAATGVGTATFGTPSVANGKFYIYTTGAVSGNQAGSRIDGAVGGGGVGSVLRGLKGRFKARFRLNFTPTTNVRQYLGLHGRTAAYETGDDPINAVAGIFLSLRGTDTVWQIAHNDTTGATVFDSTSITVDNAWHTIEIKADAADTGWMWSMDGGAFSSVMTTDVPASGTLLYPIVQIETAEAVAKNFELGYAFFETSL